MGRNHLRRVAPRLTEGAFSFLDRHFKSANQGAETLLENFHLIQQDIIETVLPQFSKRDLNLMRSNFQHLNNPHLFGKQILMAMQGVDAEISQKLGRLTFAQRVSLEIFLLK